MPLFSASFTPPDPITGLALTADVALSRVQIEWSGTALGIDFANYTVSRSRDGGATWQELAQIGSEATTLFDDYEAPLDVPLLYRVTVTNTTGYTSSPTQAGTELNVSAWWIVTPGVAATTFELAVVIDYDDERPLQQEEFEPLGRDLKIVVIGELLGHEGGITASLSREDAAKVDLIRSASLYSEPVLVKSPFGDVYRTHIGSVKRRRGTAGRQTITFPFIEVA